MSKKLMQAVRQKRLRSKSKQKNKSTEDKNEVIELLYKQVEVAYPSQKISNLLDSFAKEIETPIALYTQLFEAKSPQKCLQHNNISTLYCLNEERFLCAGCMYQSSSHKGHKVVPLNKANEYIKNNLKGNIALVEEHLRLTNRVIEKANQNLEKAEKQYPLLMEQIHNFFMDLHQLLVDRKNEQLKLVNQSWSRLRYENSTMKMEMGRMIAYIQTKLQQVLERTENDHLTFNKNVVDNLFNIQNVIQIDTISPEENNFHEDIKKFRSIYDFVQEKLILFERKNKVIQSHYHNDKLKKSPTNKGSKKSLFNSSKTIKKSKEKEKTAEERLIQLHQQDIDPEPKAFSPKNRHSINEVLLKSELSTRKLKFEKQLAKKSLSPNRSPQVVQKKDNKNVSPQKKNEKSNSLASKNKR